MGSNLDPNNYERIRIRTTTLLTSCISSSALLCYQRKEIVKTWQVHKKQMGKRYNMTHSLVQRQRTTSWLLLVFHFHYLDQILFLFSLSLIAWTGSLVVWLAATGLLLVVTTGLTVVLVTLENGLGGSECLPFLSFKELFSGSLFLESRFLVPWNDSFPLGNVDPWLIGRRFVKFELRRIWCSVSFIVSSFMQRFPSIGVALTVEPTLSLGTYCCSWFLVLSTVVLVLSICLQAP